jgi:TonB-dependent starch-binding outer membrane protein SusC
MRNFTRPREEDRRLKSIFVPSTCLIFFMRMSTLCLVLTITAGVHFLQADSVYSQTMENTYVTIEGRHMPLKTIFSKIEEQTEFLFTYPPDLVNEYEYVDIEKDQKSVREVLDFVLANSVFGYKVSNKIIVITPDRNLPNKKDESRVQADAVNIVGRVSDKEGNPLAGVYVMVRNTNRGTVTDADGKYAIEANADDWLIFSFIGYKKIEVQVGQRSVIDQVIEEDTQALQEVVINAGYYQTTERAKTGNIVRISSKDINDQPVTSPLLSLQGRVAGVEITPQSGAPGAAPRIRIRGENSLRSNGGYPLYVIDGVVIDSNPIKSQSALYTTGLDPLSTISPENIESIEILKDADATAIYGSRGANGVVLVTTKKAKVAGAHVNLGAYRGIAKFPNMIDLLNTKQYMEMRREAFRDVDFLPSEYDYDLTRWDTTKNSDWQKILLGGSAEITDIQLSLEGGSETTSFRLGGVFHEETNVISDKFGFRNANAFSSFNHRSANRRLLLSFTANYGINENRFVNINSFIESALTLPPNAPSLYLEDGSLNWDIIDYGVYKISAFTNPLAEMVKTNKNQNRTLLTNGQVSYEIFDDFYIKSDFGYTSSDGTETIKTPIRSLPPTNVGAGSRGTALFGNSHRSSWLIEPQLNWSKKVESGLFEVLIGSTVQASTARRQAISASGYTSDLLLGSLQGAASYRYLSEEYSEYRYSAVFARFGYSHRGKYLINLTGRRDGSSRFGPGNQFGNFGAVGAAWIFSEEEFVRNHLTMVSFGKVRSSYGITGNDQIGDYQYYNLFGVSPLTYQRAITLSPSGLYNRNFNWESTKKFEASIELGFFGDRLVVQGTWFRNTSSNQLIDYQLPATTGFQTILSNFDATVQNTGWEFGVQSRNVNSAKIRWTTSFNLTLPRNELTDFPGIENSPYKHTYEVGRPLSVQFLYTWKGVDPNTGLNVIEDSNGDGTLDDDDRRLFDAFDANLYGGIQNALQIGAFEFSFLIQFSKKDVIAPSWAYPGMTASNQPIDVLSRWTREGDRTDVGKFSQNYDIYFEYGLTGISNRQIVDGSFIKLKNLIFSYRFPSRLVTRLKMSECRFFLQGQNLLTLSKFDGFDPETGNGQPQLMTITGGFNVKF